MKDYNYTNERIKEIDRLIDKVQYALGVLNRSTRRVGNVADFKLTGLLGRNIVGDFIRNSKNNSINKAIDRSQDILLNLHSDLLLFDPRLASIIDLPYKLSQYGSTRNALSDMKLRIGMRKKKFDIQMAEKKLITLIKKLVKEKSKEINKLKMEAELELYK